MMTFSIDKIHKNFGVLRFAGVCNILIHEETAKTRVGFTIYDAVKCTPQAHNNLETLMIVDIDYSMPGEK